MLKKSRTRKQCEKACAAPAALHFAVAAGRPAAIGRAGRNSEFLGSRDCRDVALHSQQRNHGRISQRMEVLSRQAWGFRNFNNYRLRVKVLCS
jgi:hypothetical protein